MRDNFGRTGFHLLAYQANIHRINQVFNYLFHKGIFNLLIIAIILLIYIYIYIYIIYIKDTYRY